MTLRELAAEAESRLLAGAHPERARRDAEFLLLHASQRSRAWLLAHGDDEANAMERGALDALLERRAAGEPIQYITGEAEFYGLPFAVTRDVLIPRPETEHLVEEVLRLAAELPEGPLQIADIGTGSGAIAVALARSLPRAHLDATDLSPDALGIARKNAERNGVAGRIDFLEGDLLAPLAGRSFQMIASNPPYVPLGDVDGLAVEVREYEPHAALFAGQDGLDVYRRLVPEAHAHLAAGGWLVMEIGYGQQAAIAGLLEGIGYSGIHFVADYQGIPRVACGQLR
jgi:release factor glutamine methyltransferase